ncbi:MAG: VIT and VWA domain-containing protein [Planctomycetota bacterium]
MTTLRSSLLWLCVALSLVSGRVEAAGTLSPTADGAAPLEIRNHDVRVVINNGFARTEVTQVFHNPAARPLEAIYSFPLPKSASLSELTVTSGELEIQGEVLAKAVARQHYEEERDRGGKAGLAEKNGFQDFRFHVANVDPQGDVRVRFVYYQPLEIDTSVGRYLYPLEEGNTEDAGRSFWIQDAKVRDRFSFELELKSAWPVSEVRLPGFEQAAHVEPLSEGHYRIRIEENDTELRRDVIVYYRLADNLPGAVEVVCYKPAKDAPGTFMAIVTPALDLKALDAGADYVFLLDLSGSMQAKMQSLVGGMKRAVGALRPVDRFRIVTFATEARDVTGWRAATRENVNQAVTLIESLQADGSTNLFDGLRVSFGKLDDDRATSLLVITDAVTNTGIVDPKLFAALMKSYDIRVFGFLMGNSADVPLMRVICESTGGAHAQVSNADDLIGQIMLAKGKVTHECLHHAELKVSGVRTRDCTGESVGKVYRGQQLVLFGRYDQGGTAELTLSASLTGEDKKYRTKFTLPEVDSSHPELERLWALALIEDLEYRESIGALPTSEARGSVRDLGVAYQLVTDETSMVALADETFSRKGVERRNRDRVASENVARAQRRDAPVVSHRVDGQQPTFGRSSRPLIGGGGGGGGALDPLTLGGLALLLGIGALGGRRCRQRNAEAWS